MREAKTTNPRAPDPEGALHLAVADDEDDFRSLVRQVAEPLGWTVHEYANGRELVANLGAAYEPALIVLDMVMPQLDGIEAVGWIASTPVRCPIVLVTGKLPIYSDVANLLAQAKGLKVLDILHKPVATRRLREVLDPARVR